MTSYLIVESGPMDYKATGSEQQLLRYVMRVVVPECNRLLLLIDANSKINALMLYLSYGDTSFLTLWTFHKHQFERNIKCKRLLGFRHGVSISFRFGWLWDWDYCWLFGLKCTQCTPICFTIRKHIEATTSETMPIWASGVRGKGTEKKFWMQR